MFQIFFSALLIFFVPGASASSRCVPSHQSCDFYVCKEEEQPCGTRGYWQNFGYPYCQKFLMDENQFTSRSQLWLQDVRLCLQDRVQNLPSETTCQNLYRTAMHSHVSCYVDTGFCDLSYSEQFRVYWYLKGALRSGDTWKEAYLLKMACAQQERFSAPASSWEYIDTLL